MRNEAITIRSGRYEIEKARIWREHRTHLLWMLADLLKGNAFGEDYSTDHGLNMAINDRFREVSGDCGAFIGTIPEIMREAAKLYSEYMDRAAELVKTPIALEDHKLNASTAAILNNINNELNALYGEAGKETT